jgi:glycosyltransferase involved in cell wall biosynthesis
VKLLFVHDHRFVFRGDAVFTSTGSFPAAAWSRYLEAFDHVTVVGRAAGPDVAADGLARSDRHGVAFLSAASLGTLYGQWRGGGAADLLAEQIAQADAVVVRLPSELGLRAAAIARRMGKAHAVEVVGCAWDGYRAYGGLKASLYAPLAYARMRQAIARSPFALYVTHYWLQGRYPCHGVTAAASNVEIELPGPQALAARRTRLDAIVGGAVPVLGTVGSLAVRYKGVQTAIAALARLKAQGLTLPYRVLGAGDLEPWRAMAQAAGVGDQVRFDGVLPPGEAVRGWLDSIDIYLQPSFQEGLPRATIEAMSRGCACIGSTAGGLPELLSPDLTHRPGDVRALAAAIRRLTDDPARLAQVSASNSAGSARFESATLHARRAAFYGRLRDAALA